MQVWLDFRPGREYETGMASELTGTDWGGIVVEHEEPLVIFLVRHGQVERRAGDGPLGPGLSRLGQRQAARVAKRLSCERFDYIYTSDLVRARQTADEIAKYHKGTPVAVTSAIREVTSFHFALGGKPEGDFVREALAVERDTLIRFTNQLRHKHAPGQVVLVVAHGNLIRTILPILGGRDPAESIIMEISNSSVSVVQVWSTGDAVLCLGNCVKHLLPSQVT